MLKLKILHLFIGIALIAVLILPCYTIFVVTPLYNGFAFSETVKVVEGVASQLAFHLIDEGKIENGKLPADFIREVDEIRQVLGIWKIKIYDHDGVIAYSSDVAEIGGKLNRAVLSEMLSSGVKHTLIDQEKVVATDGVAKKIDLVESHVPIVIGGEKVGVFEIYYDITESKRNLRILTSRSALTTYLIAIILALLIVFLAAKINSSISQTEQAERKLQIYSSRLEILRKIDAAILSIQTPEAIAGIAIDHITGFMYYHSALVYSYDFVAGKSFLLAAKFRDESGAVDLSPEEDLPELDKMIRGKVFIEGPSQNGGEGQPGLYSIKVPLLTGQELVGSLEIQCDSEISMDDEEFLVVKEISSPLAIAIQNARLFAAVEEKRNQLRTLSLRLSEMEEAERRKIAVELHDRVGQNLTALNINLNIIKSRMKSGMIDGAEVCITDSFLLVEETTRQIRDIMSELRPPNLDDHGLVAAIQWYAVRRTRRSGLEIEVIGKEHGPRPALEVEMVLFRIAQESLNNIIKHAKAHAARVKIDGDGQNIIMSIEDDGIGFDNTYGNGYRGNHVGLGIVAMQERISAIGGSLKVESSKGHGSKIIVEVRT